MAGCIEFGLDPIDPEDAPPSEVIVTETFVQRALPAVDLLIVIDDTASMAQEQAALASGFGALLTDLDLAGVAWHVGVTSTDRGGADAGWLRGSPWILTPSTPDREEIFASMVQVGTDGGGPEAGLAAAVLALDLAGPGLPNVGFRRPDALLHVVFVSDSDDQSEDWLGADPVGSFLARLTLESANTGQPARASGLVGPLPGGCTSATGTAQAAERYDDVVRDSGGVAVSICAADLGPVLDSLAEASIEWTVAFSLRERPTLGTLVVHVDDVVQVDGFVLAIDATGAALVFDVPPPPGSVIDVSYLISLGG